MQVSLWLLITIFSIKHCQFVGNYLISRPKSHGCKYSMCAYIYIHCVPITIILLVISQSKRNVCGFHIPRDDEVNNHVHNLTKTIAHMYLFQKATTNRRMNVEWISFVQLYLVSSLIRLPRDLEITRVLTCQSAGRSTHGLVPAHPLFSHANSAVECCEEATTIAE